jgi:hypothetical protein
MTKTCKDCFCKSPAPAGFKSEGLCVEHFVRKVEAECETIRRQALLRTLDRERQTEVRKLLSGYALELVRLGTAGLRLSDETRCHILNAVLMLMNASERVVRLGRDAAALEAAERPAEKASPSRLPAAKERLAPDCAAATPIPPPSPQPA